MIKFNQNTPTAGDCTCDYRIDLDKEYTVGEFINSTLIRRPNEWGFFGICNVVFITGRPSCQYADGLLSTEPLPDDILKMQIKKVTSSGGWSSMDYVITI